MSASTSPFLEKEADNPFSGPSPLYCKAFLVVFHFSAHKARRRHGGSLGLPLFQYLDDGSLV